MIPVTVQGGKATLNVQKNARKTKPSSAMGGTYLRREGGIAGKLMRPRDYSETHRTSYCPRNSHPFFDRLGQCGFAAVEQKRMNKI